MEVLETYSPSQGDARENLRVQQLLDMARGIRHRPIGSPDEVARELGHYADYNGGRYGVFHIVREDDIVMAMSHTAWFDDSLQFNAIAVAPEYRGRGVARRVIYTLAQEAIVRDIDDLWVYALRSSHASKVYEHLGMTVPPPDDERHPPHSRYHPMSASPRALVERAEDTEPYALVGRLPFQDVK